MRLLLEDVALESIPEARERAELALRVLLRALRTVVDFREGLGVLLDGAPAS